MCTHSVVRQTAAERWFSSLGWVTFGANLVWLLTLYNNRLFRPAKTTATAEAD
ncbi:MAG: hypothetical protein ACE5HL_07525 [Terriglobia bacterium]